MIHEQEEKKQNIQCDDSMVVQEDEEDTSDEDNDEEEDGIICDKEREDEKSKPSNGPVKNSMEIETQKEKIPVKKIPQDLISCTSAVREIGAVLHVNQLERTVTVQGDRHQPILNEDCVLCLQDKTPLGCVDETFGPVTSPMYLLRFEHEVPQQVQPGTRVSVLTENATYVDPATIKDKGIDRDMEDEENDDDSDQAYSDDELASAARKSMQENKRKRNAERKKPPPRQRPMYYPPQPHYGFHYAYPPYGASPSYHGPPHGYGGYHHPPPPPPHYAVRQGTYPPPRPHGSYHEPQQRNFYRPEFQHQRAYQRDVHYDPYRNHPSDPHYGYNNQPSQPPPPY